MKMEVKLDRDSKAALKELTKVCNDLIKTFISLHSSIEANTAMLIENTEKRGEK